MRGCTLILDHPSQAKTLKGIGDKIAEKLTKRMEVHCAATGEPMPSRNSMGDSTRLLAFMLTI